MRHLQAPPQVASKNEDAPSECKDAVLGPHHDCFLGSDSSYVDWKKASIRRISPGVLLPP